MVRGKIRIIYFILIIAMLSAGCGEMSTDSQPGDTLKTSQWLQGFKETASLASQVPYYEIRRRNFQTSDIDFSYDEKKEVTAYAWDARYLLTSARGYGEERYFLSRQETDLTVEEPMEILADWQSRPHGYAVCMDIVKDDMIAVLFAESVSDWQEDIIGYYLVTLNAEGKFLSSQDVTKVYQELVTEGYIPGLETWWCDAEGYQYLVTGGILKKYPGRKQDGAGLDRDSRRGGAYFVGAFRGLAEPVYGHTGRNTVLYKRRRTLELELADRRTKSFIFIFGNRYLFECFARWGILLSDSGWRA